MHPLPGRHVEEPCPARRATPCHARGMVSTGCLVCLRPAAAAAVCGGVGRGRWSRPCHPLGVVKVNRKCSRALFAPGGYTYLISVSMRFIQEVMGLAVIDGVVGLAVMYEVMGRAVIERLE